MPSQSVLIVGINSAIGRPLAVTLAAKGLRVIGTSRRPEGVGDGIVHLDLAADLEAWEIPKDIGTAIVLASLTDQRQCEENAPLAYRINVKNTCGLARWLLARGIRVIFPSTNLVLGGGVPNQSAASPYAPLSLYAAQKAEVERTLLQQQGRVVICRLAKVIDARASLISGWIGDLLAHRPIRALRDLKISPVSLRYTVAFLSKLIDVDVDGVFQISGEGELSYCEFAQALARDLGRPASLVQCVDSGSLGVKLAASPIHPSLDASRTEDVFGIARQTLDELLDDLGEAYGEGCRVAI
jgi:dTDP-4-dehydrorhamnose reductase